MIYRDYYLRCPSEHDATAMLLDAGLLTAVDDAHVPVEGITIDTVGIITDGGEWDDEGNVIAEPTQRPGWHVNVRSRGELSAEQLGVISSCLVDPQPPVRVFG